jgi:IS5 family transposase
MRPRKSPQKDRQRDLFRVELSRIVDSRHGLIRLAKAVEWDRLEELFGSTYCSAAGRPAVNTRLMLALHYLKAAFSLSDEDVVRGWVENPYWQSFSGMKFFEHEAPIDPSSMTRWRKRMGEAGAGDLLRKAIECGLKI